MKSARVYLSSPHFEHNLTGLYTYLEVNKQGAAISKLSVDNFKSHLYYHLSKCKGLCSLNLFGYPTCLLSEKKKKH